MAAQRRRTQQTLPQLNAPFQMRSFTRPVPARVEGTQPADRTDTEFRTLAENLPDAVLRYDRELRCVYANPAVEACLGLVRHRLLGRTNDAIGLPRRLAALWDDSLRLVFSGGHATAIEFHLGERQVEARVVPEFGADGTVESVLTIAHDVTERTRAEQALRAKTAALERTNTELEEFAYVASHDLKGPLRNAHALSTWIEEEVAAHLSEDGRRRLALMRERLHLMDELINATLDYARAAATIDAREELALSGFIREVAAACRGGAGFSLSVAADLPRLRTDRHLLQRVLGILIGNAIDHHDRADGQISVTARDLGSFVEFAVIDDGPGIPPQYHERIFHMFQCGPEARSGSGHGLGLAIARKIVGRAGGQLRLDSAPGWGSTFRFTWPKVL